MKLLPAFFTSLVLLLAHFSPLLATTYYVKADIPPGTPSDGLSWATAYPNLQLALNDALTGDEIWVAAGTYRPSQSVGAGTDIREYTFFVNKDIKIYGGFDGISNNFSDRDWEANPTILSGDVGIPDDDIDNAYTILHLYNVSENCWIDGFQIQKGKADGSTVLGDAKSSGAGCYIGTDPISMHPINPVFRNCIFEENEAVYGGALMLQAFSGIVVSPTIFNCIFRQNTNANAGGVFYNYANGGTANALFYNSLFYFNAATEGGVLYNNSNSGTANPALINCTLIDNGAILSGGAIANYFNGTEGSGTANVTLTNTILWNNGDEIFANANANYTISYCIFDDGTEDGNVVFPSPGNVDDLGNNLDANPQIFSYPYQTEACSPGINAGNNAVLPTDFSDLDDDSDMAELLPWDLAGNDRIYDNGTVDIGVYEVQSVNSSVGGIIAGSTAVCTGTNSTTLTLSGHVGDIAKWVSDTDINFTNPSSEGSEAVQTFDNLIETTYYKANIKNGLCPEVSSSIATIEVENTNLTSNFSSPFLLCSSTNSTVLEIADYTANILKWQSDTDENFSNPIDIANTTPTLTAENLTQSIFYRVVLENACGQFFSETARLFYNPGTTTLFVDGSVVSSGDGSSWAQAFKTLQEAIDVASCPATTEIWVADGTYYPTKDANGNLTTGQEATFYLDYNVKIYGGFAGGEMDFNLRDWENNLAILSGNIGDLNTDNDNAYSVLHTVGVGSDFTVDGFTITKGDANGNLPGVNPTEYGGAWYHEASGDGSTSELILSNCIFLDNEADEGAGICIDARSGVVQDVQISNCWFERNGTNTGDGGGLLLFYSGANGTVKISQCTFFDNYADNEGSGCAFLSQNSTLQVDFVETLFDQNSENCVDSYVLNNSTQLNFYNCIFQNNQTTQDGTVLRNITSNAQAADALFFNCLFDQNYSTDEGGVLYQNVESGATPSTSFTNCTFYQNTADMGGTLVSNNALPGSSANVFFTNSILWDNTNPFINSGGEIQIGNCLFDDGNPDGMLMLPAEAIDRGNNSDADPAFVDAANGDFTIPACSPAVNAGSNTGLPLDACDLDGNMNTSEPIPYDLDNNERIYDNAVIDIGAYELQSFNSSAGGQITGSATVCGGMNSTELTLENELGTILEWQSDTDMDFTNPTVIAHTMDTYTAENLTETTHFRTKIQNGICAAVFSAPVLINVDQPAIGGIIDGGTVLCGVPNTINLSLSGETGTIIKWQVDTDENFTNPLDISNTTNTFSDIDVDENSFYRVLMENGVCQAYSDIAQVFYNPGYSSLYVDAAVAQSGNGSSWSQAFKTLQEAIDIANCPATNLIRIANGTYYPTRNAEGKLSDDTDATFYIDYDIEIQGGIDPNDFSGNAQAERNATETILSGDLGVLDDDSDNAFTILHTVNVTENFILNRITFQNGNAASSFSGNFNETILGGAWYHRANGSGVQSNPSILDCNFSDNKAFSGGAVAIHALDGATANPLFDFCTFTTNETTTGSGGAMVILSEDATASPSFANCHFSQNTSASVAGAILNLAQGTGVNNPVFANCDFYQNSAGGDASAGAIFSQCSEGEASPVFVQCDFIENIAGRYAGAIYIVAQDGLANPVISHCYFQGNSAVVNGGALFHSGSQSGGLMSPKIYNSIFFQNSTEEKGGAISNRSIDGLLSPEIINCSFVNNTATLGGNTIANELFKNGNINIELTNSILWDEPNLFDDNGGTSTITLKNSILNDGTPDGSVMFPPMVLNGGNNLDLDPLFINPGLGDLHLMPCSPAIDAGDNTALPQDSYDLNNDMDVLEPIPYDIEERRRIHDNATVDIGAYEYQTDQGFSTLYVDSVRVGLFSHGASWSRALPELSDAIAIASKCDEITEIRVAKGTYYPNRNTLGEYTTGRDATFFMDFDIELYGGFNNADFTGEVSQRNTISDATILSGDIGVWDDNTDNANSVVHTQNVSSAFLMDGFTITDGNAYIEQEDGIDAEEMGAGWFNKATSGNNSDPNIKNCQFELNQGYFGGGFANYASTGASTQPTLDNCLFSQNTAANSGLGGGIANLPQGGNTSPIIKNTTFIQNTSTFIGGAISNHVTNGEANPIITNCQFLENVAIMGGAIYNFTHNTGEPATISSTISNSLFYKNENLGDYPGSALFNVSVGASIGLFIRNSTFNQNISLLDGGINHEVANGGTIDCVIANSILWDNEVEIYPIGGNTVLINCIYDDGTPDGTLVLPNNVLNDDNNSDADPLFVDAVNGDLQLQNCSPAINAGDNVQIADDLADLDEDMDTAEKTPFDLNGNARIYNAGIVDIGAYEYQNEFCAPLSVYELDFQAKLTEEETVLLTWAATSTVPLAFFEIEYSLDGQYFEKLVRLDADENNRLWEWTHLQPQKGVNYYRIVATDVQGSQNISAIQSVLLTENQVAVFPNPTNGLTYLSIQNLNVASAMLSLTDALGQKLWVKKVSTDAIEQQVVPINLEQYSSGVYFLKIDDGKRVWIERLVKP